MTEINNEPQAISELTQKVEVIRREAESLAEQSTSFPAIWRNAERVLACVRMMELNLGQASESSEKV